MARYKYRNLLTPIMLPNGVVIRNRLTSAASTNNLLQGNVLNYPTESMITMIANRAKNGAGMVTLTGIAEAGNKGFYHGKLGIGKDGSDLFTLFDLSDKKTHPIMVQLTEAVHMQNSKILLQLITIPPKGYDVSSGGPGTSMQCPQMPVEEVSREMLDEMKATQVAWARYAQECGFDGVLVHMCYRFSLAARMLSLRTNHRTDEYGGSFENRCRWPLEICEEIKRACGNQFIVEGVISGNDPAPNGWTIEDSVRFAGMAEGKIDLLQIRHSEIDPSHPSCYQEKKYPMLDDAAAIKAAGVNIPIETIGGYNNPDDMEEILKSGKADMIATARSWISNPEFGKLVMEGRGEDVVPCIRCNKCHQRSMTSKVTAITNCSVNPVWGFEHRIDQMFDAPSEKRNVGIVGGGPAGMKAALVAADRGHDVTIYEKSDTLGGLLKCVDGISFKWALENYKNWLIRQVEKKSNIKVCLQSEATADMLTENGHDAVIISVGAEPVVPKIPGIERAKSCISVMGSEEEIAKDVVIIGGGEIGVDCGMDLAQKGHNVFVIEMLPMLSAGSMVMHYYSHVVNAWKSLPTFNYAVKARTTEVTENSVKYVDAEGVEQEVPAGTVLYAVGLKPKREEALKLFNPAEYEAYMIGDCETPGNLQVLNRSAYGTASRL